MPDADHRRHRARDTASTRRKGCATRPTSDRVRENVFNLVAAWVEDAVVLDLFAGSGAMGIEALSRGAERAVFVESQHATRAARSSTTSTSCASPAPRSSCRDVARFVAADTRTYDLVFCDPPYDEYAALEPALARYAPRLLADDGLLVLETRREDRAAAPARAAHARAATAPRALRSSTADGHRDLPRHVRPRHERAHRRDPPRGRRSSTASSIGVVNEPRHKKPMFTLDERVAFLKEALARHRQRRGRRLLRARRRLRAQVGREGDREGPARDLRLRVGVPDEPAQPHARARDRDRLRDGEPERVVRLVERREGDRRVRRQRRRARPGGGRAPLPRALSRTADPAPPRTRPRCRLARRWTSSFSSTSSTTSCTRRRPCRSPTRCGSTARRSTTSSTRCARRSPRRSSRRAGS